MVRAIRNASPGPCQIKHQIAISGREAENRRFRRSLFCVKDIKQGESFTRENIRSIRPAQGLHPRYLKDTLGRQAICDIQRGTPLNRDMISNGEK
jgi:sialic acid synthase SpsE